LTYTISDPSIQSHIKEESVSTDLVIADTVSRSMTGRPGPVSVRFEIADARIEVTERGKYVVYTIQISRCTVEDSACAKICKRYSEFDKLNTALHKQYKLAMKGIQFPLKRVSGNYTSETIARRSRAFEQYLSHLFSVPSLRSSSPFTDFFYGADIREGHRKVSNGQYEDAICVLLHAWKIQAKLLGDLSLDVVETLCAVVVCYCSLDRLDHAHSYSSLALDCVPGEDDFATTRASRLFIPLIKLAIWLRWKLNKEKVGLEERLRVLKVKGFDVEGAPTLLEVVVNEYKT